MWVGRVDIVHNAAQKGPSPPPEQALGAIAWGADVPLGRCVGRAGLEANLAPFGVDDLHHLFESEQLASIPG
jgi:hypothetical protein